MPTITVRVSPEMRRRMRMYGNVVNWSEVVRRAIMEKLRELEERNVAEALLINERLRRRAPKGWDSTLVIRGWRRRR